MRRNDPRIRQTLNQISQNIESANLTTQASLFSFSQAYISPCLSSLHSCLEASCQPCFAARDDRHQHRHRGAPRSARRGREGLAFDFYDDWEQEEGDWGNDELDRLLAGSEEAQPGKHGGMSYGSRGVGRRKSLGLPGKDGRGPEEPGGVPQSSMFGFLERLPWKIGGRRTRYRPSVADLQENVGRRGQEVEPRSDAGEGVEGRGSHGRDRSGTVESRSTANSLSSRGDLFPSDDEDDAVPIDDEFAVALERRAAGATSDDHSSGKKGGQRPSASSRTSTKTASSRESKSVRRDRRKRRDTSASSGRVSGLVDTAEEDVPTMTALEQEEEHVRKEEEAQVEQRRQAAQRLAIERGLTGEEDGPDRLASEPDAKYRSNVQGNEPPSSTQGDSVLKNPRSELPRPPPVESTTSDRPQPVVGASDPEPEPPDEPA